MLSLMGLGGLNLFGIAADYVVAAALVAGGFYVFAYVRYLGLALIVAGAVVGATAYGKSLAAADCIAAGRLASAQMRLAAAERDLAVAKMAAALKQKQLDDAAQRRALADAQLAQWQDTAARLDGDARRCRAARRDDDRRLCALVGAKAPGCTSRR